MFYPLGENSEKPLREWHPPPPPPPPHCMSKGYYNEVRIRILGFRMLVIVLEFIVPDEFFTLYKLAINE